jgi:DNA-binding MltR family transcriptional regulator
MNHGQNINEKMFAKNGKLGTFGAKIQKAKNLGLLDDGQSSDADILREIRNEFGHRDSKIHFDSPEIVQLAQKLSTYGAADSVQSAIFAATDKVMAPLKSYVKQGKA